MIIFFQSLKHFHQNLRFSINYKANSFKQEEDQYAFAFNYDGSILAATYGQDVKIWMFENRNLDKTLVKVQGHTSRICYLVYNKTMERYGRQSIEKFRIWQYPRKLYQLSAHEPKRGPINFWKWRLLKKHLENKQ